MFLKWGMDKQMVVHPGNGILLGNTKNQTTTAWMSLKCAVLSERNQTQKTIVGVHGFPVECH